MPENTSDAKELDELVQVTLPAAREHNADFARTIAEFHERWETYMRSTGQLTDETEEQRRRRTLERRRIPAVRYRVG